MWDVIVRVKILFFGGVLVFLHVGVIDVVKIVIVGYAILLIGVVMFLHFGFVNILLGGVVMFIQCGVDKIKEM